MPKWSDKKLCKSIAKDGVGLLKSNGKVQFPPAKQRKKMILLDQWSNVTLHVAPSPADDPNELLPGRIILSGA